MMSCFSALHMLQSMQSMQVFCQHLGATQAQTGTITTMVTCLQAAFARYFTVKQPLVCQVWSGEKVCRTVPHQLGMLPKDVMHFLHVILILCKNAVTSLASHKTDLDANTVDILYPKSHESELLANWAKYSNLVDVLDVELSLTLRWGEGTEVAAYAFWRWL